jgi:hypothetical protein
MGRAHAQGALQNILGLIYQYRVGKVKGVPVLN